MIDKRFCKKCGSEMEIFPGNDIDHDINVCKKCKNRTIGAHQEPYGAD
jgi:DNA-directed RNA polymerase subunit M/transcription elongation factor TFIIS